MNTNLIYHGKVVISTQNKEQVIRNNGTVNLFNLVSKFLCSELSGNIEQYLPTYVMLYMSHASMIQASPTTSSHSKEALLNVFIPVVRYTDPLSPKEANFDFSITKDQLDQFGREGDDMTLALVSGDKKNIIATIEFSSSVYNIIANGGKANVKWIMSISNVDNVII